MTRIESLAATSTGLRIGIAYMPRQRIEVTHDTLRLQSALLEPRTAQPVSTLRRVAGMLWGWL